MRHHGVEVVDFNRIGRRAFTSHGMHLKAGSKQKLVDLMVRCLRRLKPHVDEDVSNPPTTVEPLPIRPMDSAFGQLPMNLELLVASQLHTLPFDSLAEAVKSGSMMRHRDLPTSTPDTTNAKYCLTLTCIKKFRYTRTGE